MAPRRMMKPSDTTCNVSSNRATRIHTRTTNKVTVMPPTVTKIKKAETKNEIKNKLKIDVARAAKQVLESDSVDQSKASSKPPPPPTPATAATTAASQPTTRSSLRIRNALLNVPNTTVVAKPVGRHAVTRAVKPFLRSNRSTADKRSDARANIAGHHVLTYVPKMDVIDLTVDEDYSSVSMPVLIDRYFKEKTRSQLPVMSRVTKVWLRHAGKARILKMKKDSDDFERNFHIELKLGEGGFGTVYKATRNIDDLPVAIKQIPRDKIYHWDEDVNGQTVPLEVVLLRKTRHIDGVIRLIDYFERPDCFVIVMERPAKVRDLFAYIGKKDFLCERQARELFKQIVRVVEQCADIGIIHRDLKDDNLLIDIETQQVKLIDFGSGTYLKHSPYEDYQVGTKVYFPPEMVAKTPYEGISSTVWCLGLLLYTLVCGEVPFTTTSQIVKGKYGWMERDLTDEVKELIKYCLSRNPKDRPTMAQIRGHRWMTAADDQPEYVTSDVASDWSSVMQQESVGSLSSASSSSTLGLDGNSGSYI